MPEVCITTLKSNLTNATQYDIAMATLVRKRDATNNDRIIYTLRASKPTNNNAAQFVWRMTAFVVSPNNQHHCIPVGADLYIDDSDFAHRTDLYVPTLRTQSDHETVKKWDEKTWDMMHRGEQRKQYIKCELNPIIDAICNSIDKTQWRGAKRWAEVL